MPAASRVSQFGYGLSKAEAYAACGPVAAIAFAKSFGRNPTIDEAMQLARQVGWNPGMGMAGVASEQKLLQNMGVSTRLTNGVNWNDVAQDAMSGNPVIIDTPGHYFYVDGYDPGSGKFHFGTSSSDLIAANHQEWFTPQEMNGLGMGSARAALFSDHPTGGPSVATTAPGGYGYDPSNPTAPQQNAPSAIDSSSHQAFYKSFAPYAKYIGDQLGIDPSWVAAISASESGWGTAPGNELFGIKAHGKFKSQSLATHEGAGSAAVNVNQDFSAYDSPKEAADDFIDLLKNHYPGTVGAKDLGSLVHAMKAGGYFTAGEGEYLNLVNSLYNEGSSTVQAALQNPTNVITGGPGQSQTLSAGTASGGAPQQPPDYGKMIMDSLGRAMGSINPLHINVNDGGNFGRGIISGNMNDGGIFSNSPFTGPNVQIPDMGGPNIRMGDQTYTPYGQFTTPPITFAPTVDQSTFAYKPISLLGQKYA